MQAFRYRDLDKFVVDGVGRVRLPKHKQRALHYLAWQQGRGGVNVRSIKTYEAAIFAILEPGQRPRLEAKLADYQARGFARYRKENLSGFSVTTGLSPDQDIAWLDFLELMTQYERLCASQ
jgi:hypothetical protein